MLSKLKLNQLYFKDTQFANLMTRRIFNVLLIANPYDAFMLEDDGRIDEKIFNEYTSLSLRYPPRFTQVSTCEEALAQLSTVPFDLIICMPGTGDNDSFDVARHIKSLYEHIPMVILTPFSHGITKRIANEDLSPFEYIFCWLGNTDLLVSIIKLIEDKMNLEHDVNEVGVQVILVVEDDAPIRNLITTTLKTQDYKYIAAATASEALQQATIHAPDVMLLDLGLPDLDGIEVIRRIRSWSAMPIIVISARSEDSDKIEALDSGADDYLTKPFSVEELLARLRVTFRRISMLHNAAGWSVFTNGDLQIDFAAGCATLKGQELHLTPIEYRLLCVMAKNCGKVLTHTYITHEVWGSSWDNDVASLRVFMATLRKKLESEPDSPQYIQTHIGIGYRMLKV